MIADPGRRPVTGPDHALGVGVVGYGAIGTVVAGALARGEVPGATLAGVCTRDGGESHVDVNPTLPLDELIERSDVVVECAGHAAVGAIGPAVLNAGRDLLLVSVGALADDHVFASLRAAGPGRLLLSTGALGGIDLVRAATLAGPLERLRLVTTKPPAAFLHASFVRDEAERLETAAEPIVLFDGTAREAAARFPRSANVAAALAFAAGGWERVEAAVVADPSAVCTEHDISYSGEAGEYRFTIRNRPAHTNRATSAVVPYAVLRALSDEASAAPWRFR